MHYKPRNTFQSRTLTPRAHVYRLLKSSPKQQLITDSKAFSSLASETPSLMKPSMSLRGLNTHRISSSTIQQHSRSKQLSKVSLKNRNSNHFQVSFMVSDDNQVQFTSTAQNIGQLLEETKKVLSNKRIKFRPFVLQHQSDNLTLDYYLTVLQGQTTDFEGTKLKLKPYYLTSQTAITINSFEIIKLIGSGGFSKVFLARFKGNGLFYAMKIISKSFIVKHKKEQLILNERNVMADINHSLHAKLHWAFQSRNSIVFVMDYYPGGQLFGLIKKYRKMTEAMARFYMIEILLALEKLHQHGIAYRDMKPENILIDHEGHVHLADFGLVKPGLRGEGTKAYSFCGSPQYMPPEIVARKGHSLSADFYSIGALLYELVTGLPPFYNRDPQKIYSATLKQKMNYASHLSSDLKHLLDGLLCKDQDKRMGAKYGVKEILSHSWFGKVNVRDYLDRKLEAPVKFNKLQDIKFPQDQDSNKGQAMLEMLRREQSGASDYRKMLQNFSYGANYLSLSSKPSRLDINTSRQQKTRGNRSLLTRRKRKTQENDAELLNVSSQLNNYM